MRAQLSEVLPELNVRYVRIDINFFGSQDVCDTVGTTGSKDK